MIRYEGLEERKTLTINDHDNSDVHDARLSNDAVSVTAASAGVVVRRDLGGGGGGEEGGDVGEGIHLFGVRGGNGG